MRTIKEKTLSGTMSDQVTEREERGREVARAAAVESIVLLKNEDRILPIATDEKIVLYGSGVTRTIKGGTGSGDVNERHSVSIYEGMVAAGYQICNQDWIDSYEKIFQKAWEAWRDEILVKSKEAEKGGGQPELTVFDAYAKTPFHRPIGDPVKKEDAQTAIYVLSRVAGEGADRRAEQGDYLLSDDEEKMIADICDLYPNVIVVINTGGQMDLSFLDKHPQIKGVLSISQLGQEGGHALADVISGKVNPSGKLADTWTYHYNDYPEAQEFSLNNGDISKDIYKEGIYVGYRYFDSYRIPVRYGFGYGLSYTTFEISGQKAMLLEEDDKATGLRLTFNVTNTGAVAGKEVVQIYASCPQPGWSARLEKERRRLIGFEKTKKLLPGEMQSIHMDIPLDALESYQTNGGWVLEGGDYAIWAGNSLESAKIGLILRLDKSVLTKGTASICKPQIEIDEYQRPQTLIMQDIKEVSEAVSAGVSVIEVSADQIETQRLEYKENTAHCTEEEAAFAEKLTTDQLVELVCGDPGKGQGSVIGSAGISVPGSAGETSSAAIEEGMPNITLADGPAGLRLSRSYRVRDGRPVTQSFLANFEGGVFLSEEDRDEQESDLVYYQYCTAVPVGTALAQTWNTKLVETVGSMVGEELQEFGVTLWLAPGMNIHKNPLCGRNFEYYSEDPLISGFMAAAMTKGVQSHDGCGTTIKHFACNSQEENRTGVDSILSERALREIYLKGFEIAVKTAQPYAIMTSYNLVNGVHAANSYDLCTQAARNEWGFDGLIMTDWMTTLHGPDCTASGCMRAGNDLVMPGFPSDYENLRQELAEGTVTEEELRACVGRIYRVTQKADRFEG